MKFDAKKLKGIARPMTQNERQEMEYREDNREWLALSAEFALLVRQILRTEALPQKELAKRMGVSDVQVSKLLSGKENICLQTIVKVEKALGRNLILFGDRQPYIPCPEHRAILKPYPCPDLASGQESEISQLMVCEPSDD